MKSAFSLLLVPILLLISVQGSATIHTWHTPEGAKVLFMQNNALPIVDIALNFDAASSRDNGRFGLAKLTAQMIGTHSKYHNESEIIDAFSSVGAEFSSTALKDMAIISLRTLSRKEILNPTIQLFSEVVAEPVFKRDILNRFKKQNTQAILASYDKPATLAQEIFIKTLYQNHPYTQPSVGTTKTIKQINLSHIKQHYKQYYVGKNLNIAMVGDLSLAQAKSVARQITHHLNSGQKASTLAQVAEVKGTTKHIDYDSTQSHLIIAKKGISRSDKHYHSLYLANHIFGGGALTSVLGRVIREKNGLAYSVYSYFQPMKLGGFFAINLQTKNAQLKKAKKLTLETLDNFIKQGINEQSVQEAKDYIIGSFALRTASNEQILSHLSLIGFYELPLDYLTQFPPKIAQLSVKEVQNSVAEFFKDSRWVIVSLGG